MTPKSSTDGVVSGIRSVLKPLEFPTNAAEALNQLQKLLADFSDTPVSPQVVQVCNDVIESFVFFERRRKPLSSIEELQVLDVICTTFQSLSHKTCKNMFFIMFPTSDGKLLERRMDLLTKLISLSITLKANSILDCAAYWLHIIGVDNAVSLRITRQLLDELFDNGVSLSVSHDPANLIISSPSFCATLVTVATQIYSTSMPPAAFMELLALWLDKDMNLSYIPLETLMPNAQTFVPGLISWIIFATPTTPLEQTILDKLHLATLKVILKSPHSILNEAHIVHLASRLRRDDVDHVEKFVQVVQACLKSKCFHSKPASIGGLLESLPPTRLTGIVLESNMAYLK